MKRNNFVGIIFALLPFLIISFLTSAFNSAESNYEPPIDTTYYITSMLVEIEATEDRVAYIKETIDVSFNEARAAIIRDIPVNGGVEIRDINVEGRVFSVEKYGKFLAVDMDSTNFKESTDSRQYIISYTLDYSKAIAKNISAKDSIPLNVIGTGWPTTIDNAEIIITLPDQQIDSYYYVGKRGVTTGANRLDIVQVGNTISISVNNRLQPFEGVTVGYDMPKGLMNSPIETTIIWKIIFAGIYLFIVYLVFVYFGKDEEITPVINFTAPTNITPADAGYLIDGTVSPTDMTSLIYYWASHNHLNIKDEKDGKNIELIKVSDLDKDHKGYESFMFSSLFSNNKKSVKISSLKESYYLTLTNAQTQVKTSYSGKLMRPNSTMISIAMLIIAVIITGIAVVISSHKVSANYNNYIGFASIIPAGIIYAIGTAMFKYEPKLIKSKMSFYSFFCVAVFVISFIYYLVLKNSFVPLYDSMVISTAFAFSMCIIPFIQMRSEYYHDILNQLLGFRNFLLNAEKDRLELLINENPQYYYDILPYANVLGVSDQWMKKFKDLTIPPPTWYYSNRPFSLILFNTAFIRSMSSISTTMVSRPAPSGSSGGGFGGGGGGFSGGGFGGGGGRSR